MTTSLSNHGPSARSVDALEENPHDEGNRDEARLRGLSHQQLADRLKWLSWYQPGVFTAVMDYVGFCENLAADTHPTNPASDDVNYGEIPPRCAHDAAPTSASSSSSALIGGTIGTTPP